MSIRMIILILLCRSSLALGEVTFEWVTVGDPGNEPDRSSSRPPKFYGGVDYEFRMSKHEVTNEQYAEFLGAVALEDPQELFHPGMRIVRTGASGSFNYSATPGFEKHPVTHIRFFDAMRFVNWLENGQNSGGTESGTYTISDGVSEMRASKANYFIPSDEEWYKAAFYDPTLEDGAGGYWKFATQSNNFPNFARPPGGRNSVNTAESDLGGTTEVGAYRFSMSYYGTFDQTGNVGEWTETIVTSAFGSGRIKRLPSWGDSVFFKTSGDGNDRAAAAPFTGFRVASRIPFPISFFRRGDCNDDSAVDISDPIFTLRVQFFGDGNPSCDDACDSNDDGAIDVSDAVMALSAIFLGQNSLPLPGVEKCGEDPTLDNLECEINRGCL